MTLTDMRFRRLMEDLVYPSPKEGMNPRSLSFLRLVLCNKKKSVLFATFPKSGWNWTGDILEYCITKKYTGEFNLEYRESGTLKERMKKPIKAFSPADSRSRNRKTVREVFPEIDVDYCLHTHGHWKDSPLWGLDQAKTVFIVRDIRSSLFSYYKSKLQIKDFQDFQDFLKKGNLDRALLYYNTWGEFCQKPGSRYKVFKYEDMRKDPATNFAAMYEYVFGRTIEADILEEALDFFSFENQKKREFQFEKDESKHFHFQGKTDYTDQMSEEAVTMIRDCLNRELKHTFGYDYQ